MAPAKSRLWVVPTQGGGADRPLPGSEEGDHAARWAPDGTTLAFIGQRGHADTQHVMLARPWTAPAHTVGELKGSPLSLRWSPDGRFLAVITTEKAAPEARGAVMEGAKGATHLLIVDVQTGRSREVPMDGKQVFDVDWSPAGDRLVLRTGEEGGWIITGIVPVSKLSPLMVIRSRSCRIARRPCIRLFPLTDSLFSTVSFPNTGLPEVSRGLT